MFTQVRLDEINVLDRNAIFLGVTEIPPGQLTVTTWSTDPENSVIIWESGVRRKGYKVSFMVKVVSEYCRLV